MRLIGKIVRTSTFGLCCAALLVGCSGQVVIGPSSNSNSSQDRSAQGPPAHAPAHGQRRQYQYRYWSKHDVYFDLQNRQYVWYDRGTWHVGRSLPGQFPVDTSGGMYMETQTPLPWLDRPAPRQGGIVAGFYD